MQRKLLFTIAFALFALTMAASARALEQRKLLKKLDQNFHPTESSRTDKFLFKSERAI